MRARPGRRQAGGDAIVRLSEGHVGSGGFVCRELRRHAPELIPATFRVYPVKDYGAIEEGEHRFCDVATGRCEGIARFVVVWAKREGMWQTTCVLSYGHRAAVAAE